LTRREEALRIGKAEVDSDACPYGNRVDGCRTGRTHGNTHPALIPEAWIGE